MDTLVEFKLYGQNAESAMEQAFDKIKEIEYRMSVTLSGSEVSLINANAGKHPVQVSSDTYTVIKEALHYSELTSGAFDPTVGPLVAAWGIGGENPRVPSKTELRRLTGLIDYRKVHLDPQARSVFLAQPEMSIDLGGIAKGYAADEVVKVLRENNITSGYVSLGGNVYVIGAKPDGSPWRIGIRNPFDDSGRSFIGVASVTDTSLVTSGTYERFFIADGVKYHHILDPDTGYPVVSDLASVTIVSPNSMAADGLSTSVFILGKKNGKALIESLPGVEAILVDNDRHVWISPGLQGKVELSEGFTVE